MTAPLSDLMGAALGTPETSRALNTPSQMDVGAHDLRTSHGGRAYLAEYFVKRLKRHDFTRYITEILAADFACALAQHLTAPPAAENAQDCERQKRLIDELSKIIHNMVVADQAAWIEWRHGKGAEAAMQWIGNGLLGPGHIPAEDEPYSTEAQAWYDANRADAFPACHCGRPSNILHMGKGYCSPEHYEAAIAARQSTQGAGTIRS